MCSADAKVAGVLVASAEVGDPRGVGTGTAGDRRRRPHVLAAPGASGHREAADSVDIELHEFFLGGKTPQSCAVA